MCVYAYTIHTYIQVHKHTHIHAYTYIYNHTLIHHYTRMHTCKHTYKCPHMAGQWWLAWSTTARTVKQENPVSKNQSKTKKIHTHMNRLMHVHNK